MNPMLLLYAIVVTLLPASYASLVPQLHKCQNVNAKQPLQGCPRGTLYVSAANKKAHFTSIQDAIDSLPSDDSPGIILVGAGGYTEQLNVTRPGPLTLLGETDSSARGGYANIEQDGPSTNKVNVLWRAANSNSSYADNVHTSVLVVGPTYEATLTGSGPTGYPVPPDTPFGCSDFRAYNIDFRNEYALQSSGPSHALAVAYANAGFYSCGFYSYQDTVFAGKLGNIFMHDSIVAGQTDFLYGFGTLFIQKSIMAANATVAVNSRNKCSLGRPWNSLHRSVFLKSYFDSTILPAGYTQWAGQPNGNYGPNTTMALYRTFGPGNNAAAQTESNVTTILIRAEAKEFLEPKDVFMDPAGKQPNFSARSNKANGMTTTLKNSDM
ncbi:hypothetical protein NM208_g1242 [Fusarium decemcellulare]|uniref:Uncharacterized protein n=1 Tax=Fusarium decemcellulare TaxID=57161 RepID=A0ACC1SX21_9HYPO|nr:hypothetical protein NM208_g1242 [Fusarium decemcellulare]